MKNLKIKHKLYLLSAVLIVTLICTSIMSLQLMNDVNDGTTVVSTNWLPSVIIAEELNTNTSDFRIVEASHVISQDDETMKKHEETIANISEEIDILFENYENYMIVSDIDRDMIKEAKYLWEEYLEVHAKMIVFSRENDTESAMNIIENESKEIFDEVSGIFLNLVQFNKNGADQASIDGDNIFNHTILMFLLIMIFAICIGVLWSKIIIQSITKPVHEIETATLKILTGDLSAEINYKSDDELGKLSSSMRELCIMIQGVIADLSQLLRGLASGDFTVKSQKTEFYIGEFAPLLELTNNISDKLSEALLQIHHKDALTDFYNRAGYSKNIETILAKNPKSIGVISVNINGLKNINENYGNVAGDNHIMKSAKKLKEHFGYEFFRMSGDEILGVAPNVLEDEFLLKVNELFEEMKSDENFDFSFGHAYGVKNFDIWKLMQEAETIMYINKQEYYKKSNRKSNQVDNKLLSELLSYLADDEFMIYLQPQVKLKDASLYGAEALIRRFDKKNEKMVFPDQFISLYEQKSIIRHVDIFVVESVCKLLSEWGKNDKAIPISVNLSRVTLQEYGIVNTIVEICDKYNVPHKLLVIEVTERVGLIENNVASSLIRDFKENGFNISLDDFGCAYSNIVTLAQIEVDEVKIDKSLVDDLTKNRKNNILVKNVLTMCKELENTSTLAEGIEDESQAKLLYELGCHLGQGYFFSRPIPVDQFVENYIK